MKRVLLADLPIERVVQDRQQSVTELRVGVELDGATQTTHSLAEKVDLRERVRLAGEEQRGAADLREMRGTRRGPVGRAGWMEREREQDQGRVRR